MTIEEYTARFRHKPPFHIFGWGIFFCNEFWRLPYRWYEFKKFKKDDGGGFSLMIGGATVMITKFSKIKYLNALAIYLIS